MQIVGGKRYCGKTTELIRISNINKIPIIVVDNKRKEIVIHAAKELGLEIPIPMTYKEYKPGIREHRILIDDLEDILMDMFKCSRIVEITTSMPFKPLEQIKK